MRIGFITTDWSYITDEDGFPTLGGSAYYRIGLPYMMLKEHGYDVHLGSHLGRDKITGELGMANWKEEVTRELDIIVLHRWMESHAAESILGGRAAGQVIINDVDDHFDGISAQNQAFITTHPRYNRTANREHYKKALAASSALTVSTPFFQKWARQRWAQEKSILLRNMIDLRLWSGDSFLGGPPTVGWVGMTSHRSGDLETIAGVLGTYLTQNGGRFHHSGYWEAFPYASRLLGIPDNIMCTTSPPQRIDKVPLLYKNFNIGIVPLKDIPFNHAKSCIKGLEYAAAGIPFVASSTPEYEWLRRAGVGLTARKLKDWKRCLLVLADEQTRKNVAHAQRIAIESLSAEARWREWVDAYATLLAECR